VPELGSSKTCSAANAPPCPRPVEDVESSFRSDSWIVGDRAPLFSDLRRQRVSGALGGAGVSVCAERERCSSKIAGCCPRPLTLIDRDLLVGDAERERAPEHHRQVFVVVLMDEGPGSLVVRPIRISVEPSLREQCRTWRPWTLSVLGASAKRITGIPSPPGSGACKSALPLSGRAPPRAQLVSKRAVKPLLDHLEERGYLNASRTPTTTAPNASSPPPAENT
jgi:hypothetical protein